MVDTVVRAAFAVGAFAAMVGLHALGLHRHPCPNCVPENGCGQ